MNKKSLITLFIILGLSAAGCRSGRSNSSEESSSVVSSSEGSSEVVSSSSSSSQTHTHTPKEEWAHNKTTHWHYCTANDGAKLNESVHTFSVATTKEATYEEKGTKTYTCTVCGYSYDEDIPQLVHQYSDEWSKNETKHWHACIDEGYADLKKGEAEHSFTSEVTVEATYDHAGKRNYTCSVCGYHYIEDIPQLVHNYSTDWTNDMNKHWHACTDTGYTDLKSDESEHSYTSAVTTEPTYEHAGVRTYTCSVCGYHYNEDIPQLEHHYSTEWTSSASKHWHACIDEGYTNLKQGEADHTFEVKEVVQPTTTESGYTVYKCSVCNYEKNDDYVDPIGEDHHYSTEWSHDEANHWHACTDEGCDAKSDVAKHDYKEEVTLEPSYEAKGIKRYTCKVCDYYYEEDIPQLVHHYSTEWSKNETKHWHACIDEGYTNLKQGEADHTYNSSIVKEATHDHTGIKRYTCSVCGYYYDEVIPQVEHTFSTEWTHDETHHWHKCTGCDAIADKAEHTYNASVVEEPTHDHAGTRRYTCSVCGYYYDEVIPQVEHTFSTEWTHDEAHHWHKCTGCDAIADKAEHSYGDPVFTPSENPDYKQYIKGVNTYTCECGYSYNENALFTKQEICDLMNAYIAGKEYFDIFEMRDDLNTTYPVEDFGYDNTLNKVVVFENPTENVSSFKSTTVATFGELVEAIRKVNENEANFSIIKLANDLTIDESILINGSNPIAIDLGGHTLKSAQEKDGIIKISKQGTQVSPIVAIYNGSIETKEISTVEDGYDLSKSPSCVFVTDAVSVRVSDVHLNNKAERGYGYIDYPKANGEASVKINDCVIDSKIVAICIQTNTNIIYGNTVNGNVVINGGSTAIVKNNITAKLVEDSYTGTIDSLVPSVDVYGYAKAYILDEGKEYYMFTSTDAITILDRRSENSVYSLPAVYIHDNTLTCVASASGTPYGYGVRYIDLNLDPNKSKNAYDSDLIEIGDQRTSAEDTNGNTYTYYSGTLLAPGGVDIYYLHEVAG